jgi:hypothetical protein
LEENQSNLGRDGVERSAIDHFLSLKDTYKKQRDPWLEKWDQARASVYLNDNLDKVYNGRSNIKSPIMFIKWRAIWARISKVIFNSDPVGRIQETKVEKIDGDIVDLHNDYIFKYQLDRINYKESQKQLIRDKTLLGTSVGKVTQEFEEAEISFSDDEEPKKYVVKDDTYLRPVLLEEFYSDVNKSDIEESDACIHHTVISMNDIYNNRERKVTEEFEVLDNGGNVVAIETETKTEGVYKNLDLIVGDGDNITEEQEQYAQYMGWSNTATKQYFKTIKKINKSGSVDIDECYGLFDLKGNGKLEECICVIAEGKVCIRLEPTPFKHRRYRRPFIVGKYIPVSNCLYGLSNTILGNNLLQEYNASRSQATDAKTRSVSPMWYQDATKMVKWDGVWRPDGVIRGQGQNGMTPVINPNLSNVPLNDSIVISQDIDRLWSLSPVQEGSTDPGMIPSTARGTIAVIRQNDMPINDVIEDTIEFEVKKFIEILLERNITFKTLDDYLVVWDEDKIQKSLQGVQSMTDLFFDFNVQILGTLELANEVSHQQGYIQFAQSAANIPQIADRIDWKAYGDKLLRSYGIKDDATDQLWLTDDEYAKKKQQEQQAQQQALIQKEQIRQKIRLEELEDYQFKKEVDTESELVQEQVKTQGNIIEKNAEATIEKITGENVA